MARRGPDSVVSSAHFAVNVNRRLKSSQLLLKLLPQSRHPACHRAPSRYPASAHHPAILPAIELLPAIPLLPAILPAIAVPGLLSFSSRLIVLVTLYYLSHFQC